MSASGWPIAPAAVALDLLDADEHALAERLLADDPTFRAEVERLRTATAALPALDRTAWEPVPPPPLASDVIATPQDPPAARRAWRAGRARGSRRTERNATRPRPRPRRAPLLAAASGLGLAVAAAAALAIVLLTGGDPHPDTTTIALRALAGTPGRASLTLSGADAQLRGSGLPPSGAHDYYEAWLADARGRMVSMGTFRVGRDGSLDVRMAVAVDVSRYTLVDVSLEPDDGDPGHSDRSVLRATL
jgi:anti-sigma-K factor RskA